MRIEIRVHNQGGVVMPMGKKKDYNIKVQLDDLHDMGLGIIEGTMTDIQLSEPMIVTGFTIVGINDEED